MIKKKIFVDFSKIDLKLLAWLPLVETSVFPMQPAIYFAINARGTVLYVGRSGNLRDRWRNHHKFNELIKLKNIKIAFLFIKRIKLLPEIEAQAIKFYKPKLNKQGLVKKKPIKKPPVRKA